MAGRLIRSQSRSLSDSRNQVRLDRKQLIVDDAILDIREAQQPTLQLVCFLAHLLNAVCIVHKVVVVGPGPFLPELEDCTAMADDLLTKHLDHPVVEEGVDDWEAEAYRGK